MNCLTGNIRLIESGVRASLGLDRPAMSGTITQICELTPDGALYTFDNLLVVSSINEIILVSHA